MMPWTNTQKQIAARACKAAGINDEQRRLILRQLPNAFYDRKGNAVDEPTSTSRKLTNPDMEQFMATVEDFAGGKVLHFERGYWSSANQSRLSRMRNLVARIAAALEAAGLLEPDGVGLAGWIERFAADEHRTARLDRLTYGEMHKLINGIRAYAQRHDVTWDGSGADADTPSVRPLHGRIEAASTRLRQPVALRPLLARFAACGRCAARGGISE